ncbi:MAG TPA: hypothetical protein VN698_13035 [Bacteroidia bacterium]|nr:hypothetical protein [Bacteroidia bacterium]
MVINAEIIPKEQLSGFRFAEEDVLSDASKRSIRHAWLKKAERLGNGYKGKVKMIFKSKLGKIYSVETTIWAIMDDYVALKGGISVPIKAVLDIEF